MDAGHQLEEVEQNYVRLQVERNALVQEHPNAKARTKEVRARIQHLKDMVKKLAKDRPADDPLKIMFKSTPPMSPAERMRASRMAKSTEEKAKERENDRLRKATPKERERTRLQVARFREGRKNVSLQATPGKKRVKLAGDKSHQAGVSSPGGVRPLPKKSKSGSEQQQSFAGVGCSSSQPTRLKKSKSGLEQSSAGVGCSSSRTPVNSANGVQGESSPGVGCSSTRTPSKSDILKKSKRVEQKKSSAGVGCSPSRTPANSAIVVPVEEEVESCQPPDESSAGVSRSWTRTPVNSAGNRRLSFADDLGGDLETCSSAPDILHPEQFPAYPEWKFSCSNLSCKEEEEVKELADLLQAQFVKEYERSVTHLIVKTDDKFMTGRTPEYLRALVRGSWIVSSEWVKEALADPSYIGQKICSFEALDEETEGKPGAQRARRGRYSDEVELFDSTDVCLVGEMVSYDTYLLKELIEKSGGRLVSSPSLLTSPAGRSFLVSESPLHSERHRSELTSYMLASGALPVSVDYILDCIGSHEMLPVEGKKTYVNTTYNHSSGLNTHIKCLEIS